MSRGSKTVATGIAALLIGLLGIVAYDRFGVAEPPLQPSSRAAISAGSRVVFPSDRHPALALPNGRSRSVRSLLNVPDRMRYGQYVWNEEDVPPGPVWVRVDLAHQTLSVFRAGHEIGTAVILYGMDGMATPTGVFPILQKAAQHRSSLYDADMPFMLRLTGDGIAIHASNVRIGYATHGCIGIPEAFARLLFAQVERGDEVAILPA